jgi:GMP synthase (glutamine-hydrolysing)
VPVLGICYGMQTMAEQLGGKVIAGEKHEFGYARVQKEQANTLLDGITDHEEAGKDFLDVWMSHGDRVGTLPKGFVATASTDSCPIAGMANDQKHFYGLQFHPEVTHTLQGGRMLERFVRDICGCEKLWTPDNIIEDAIEQIRELVRDEEVILGLSGGVDSSVTAALLHRAIGKQLTCVFVDNGLLRHQEGDGNVCQKYGRESHSRRRRRAVSVTTGRRG